MSTIAETASVRAAEKSASALPRYTVRPYRLPAKIFHWVTASLIVFMVVSGVTMKQIEGMALADTIFTLHKTAGALIVALVLARFAYRVLRPDPAWRSETHRRPYVHWLLYGLLLVVPLLGWAGISDFGARGILGGYELPAIWPEGLGYSHLLFEAHAYAAFGMLVIVALHIGMAIQDHMMRSRAEIEDEAD